MKRREREVILKRLFFFLRRSILLAGVNSCSSHKYTFLRRAVSDLSNRCSSFSETENLWLFDLLSAAESSSSSCSLIDLF